MIMAKEYIHLPTIGQVDQCLTTIASTKQKLVEAYDHLALRGYLLLFISSESDIQDNLIFSDYNKHTGNSFPFIYAMVQPTNEGGEIDTFMQMLGYIPVLPGYYDDLVGLESAGKV